MDLTAGKPLSAAVLALLATSTALAQLGDEIPHASYYAAVQALYGGEYRVATRELGRETQHGVRAAQTRWVDSICYFAMYGEVLYHQGRNTEALGQFDQACQLILAYPNWLLQVRFQQNPRLDANRARRVPTWGRSQRTFVIGQFSNTEQVLVGDLDASKTVQQGGVFRTPMLWRVNVVEVMRMSALAIRRRNEILGPLAAQDPINKQLSAALSANNLAPANHWSWAWIDLLRGLAQEGAGKLDEADNLLGRSLVIDGQFDHPLTGVGLMEQGRIAAMQRGNRTTC
jgi:tetratricopeptide (TPR) repeat protein